MPRLPPFIQSQLGFSPFAQPSPVRSQFDLHDPVHVSRILEVLMKLPVETKEYLSKFVNALIPYVYQDLDLLTALTVMRNHLHQAMPSEQMTQQFRPPFGGPNFPFPTAPFFRPEAPADVLNGSFDPEIPNDSIMPGFFRNEDRENNFRLDAPEDSIDLDLQDAVNSGAIAPKLGQAVAGKATEAVKPVVDSAKKVANDSGISLEKL